MSCTSGEVFIKKKMFCKDLKHISLENPKQIVLAKSSCPMFYEKLTKHFLKQTHTIHIFSSYIH